MRWQWKNCTYALQVQYQVHRKSPSSFLKQLYHKTFEFGTLSSGCPGLAMTSSYCSRLYCLQSCVREKLLCVTIPSMITTWAIIFVMIFILRVQPSLRPSSIQGVRTDLTFRKDNKELETMSRGHLECPRLFCSCPWTCKNIGSRNIMGHDDKLCDHAQHGFGG